MSWEVAKYPMLLCKQCGKVMEPRRLPSGATERLSTFLRRSYCPPPATCSRDANKRGGVAYMKRRFRPGPHQDQK